MFNPKALLRRPNSIVEGLFRSRLLARPSVGVAAFFVISYLIMLANTAGYLSGMSFPSLTVGVFAVLVHFTYSAFYLLPAAILVFLLHLALIRRAHGTDGVPVWRRLTVLVVAVLLTAATQFAVYTDKAINTLFGYHLNSFVWNLLTTPGGIESLGGGSQLELTALLVALLFLAAQIAAALAVTLSKAGVYARSIVTARTVALLLCILVVASTAERLIYSWSALKANTSVLTIGHDFPFYKTTSLRSLAERVGIEVVRRQDEEFKEVANSSIHYPLAPLQLIPPTKPMNILWLTAESLRADALTEEIMPATWAFSQRAHRFENHYSGGNGTRMGMFALFYGLHGNYWFPFLVEQRAPLLFDVLALQNYQYSMYTSARFTYPEFDKTIFAAVPHEDLHEGTMGTGWEKDRENVDNLLGFLDARETSRPFMAFLFFESPHANYYFPEESVIRQTYLNEFNYATMDPGRDMPLIHNRYINSVHHLDSQLGRLLAGLEARDLLDSTIVVISGDHGEEFMEHGRWGHNSAFTNQQVKTPLVLWIPGTGSAVHTKMSSHVDVIPTILPLLGVTNPITDYSVGVDLLGPEERTWAVVADWSKICYIDGQYKAAYRYRAGGDAIQPPSTVDDATVTDEAGFAVTHKAGVLTLSRELARFVARRGQ